MGEVVLGECLDALIDHRGKTPKKLGGDFSQGGGVPVASAMLIQSGRLLLEEARCVDQQMYNRWMQVPTCKNDVLLTSEAPLGRLALVPSDDPLVLGQRLFGLRGKPGVLDSRFLYYHLQTESAQGELLSRATGTTVVGIRQSELRKVRLCVPDYGDQVAIGELLGALDEKIAVNERIAATYESILVVEFDQLGVDVDAGESQYVSTSELVECNPHIVAPKGDDVIYVDMAALPTSSARVQDWTRRAPKSGTRFSNGDTVMARITPCLENGKTAYIDFMEDGEVGAGSTEFIVMRPREGVPSQFPYFLARSQRFRRNAIRNMVGSSGRQRVSAAQIADIPIFPPESSALAKFGYYAEKSFAHMKSLGQENIDLAQLRDTLLPKLMSGEIRVRDAEKAVEEAT